MDTLLLHMMFIGTLAVQVKSGVQKENIARGKPTKFSATGSIQSSDLAVDGDPDTFAMSQVQTTPSWRVDLQRVYWVEAVSITNRKDCCPETLDGAQIHVGVTSSGMPRCAVVSAVPLGETYTYSCYGMEGRYVSIFIPGDGNQLALNEVQVFGKPAENLALGKEATQSSDFFYETYSKAASAVDGSRDNQDHSVCSGTNGQDYPWWKVDLLEEYKISTVTITSRGDCCEDLLKQAEIHVSNSPDIDHNSDETLCVVMKNGIARGATNTYVCSNMAGRYVAVFGPGQNGYVFLCEVEVTGLPAVIPTPTPTPVPTIPPTSPPPLPLMVSGRTMVLVREQLSWFEALLHCRSLYRDLASLRSPEEQLEVGQALLLHGAQTTHVWLGLRRRMLSGEWYWMNGEEMDHSNWEGREAQYHEVQRISSCGAAANMGECHWSHRPCMEQLNFLCYTDDDPDYSPVQFAITYARK